MRRRPTTRVRRRGAALLAALALLATAGATVAPAGAQAPTAAADAAADAAGGGGRRPSCDRLPNVTYRLLLNCVSGAGATEHLEAFQEIADANGGTRASGTPGFDRSVDYVAGALERAGYAVTRQAFPFAFFDELSPAVLEVVTPAPATIETGSFTYSGAGEVTGPVIPVDVNLVGDRASTSGCEPEDFAGLDFSGPADVALTQRGTCDFAVKAQNAQAAGAEAVIIFNQGNDPGRTELLVGTLGESSVGVVNVPVVGASFDDGAALATPGTTVHVVTDTVVETRTTYNVLAESRWGRDENVVMAGAHLDSVTAGPGINDNGSGSAALLDTALALGRAPTLNKLRFAWWGAEEGGLFGSAHYVGSLTEDEAADIALYMNFDMVGSPNYVQAVYDADESTFPAEDFDVVVPEGSIAVEDVFETFYTWRDVPYDDTAFSGRSDYEAFILADIPASGLFTGAEVAKTEEQAAIWGGTAGESFDPCYHEACDDIDNLAAEALDVNTDAVAFATLTFAFSTESVNGVRGIRVPGHVRLPAPAGPEGTFVTDAGHAPLGVA